MHRFVTWIAALVFVAAIAHDAGAQAADLDLIAPVDGPIARHFEPPPTPFAAGHRGIDYATPEGAPVVAAAAGIVAFAGQVGGDLFVSIDHDGGYRTTYSFLSQVAVRAGAVVEQGAPIARSGLGHGDDDEAELHFGLRLDGDYVDPEPYLVRSMRRNLWRVVHLTA